MSYPLAEMLANMEVKDPELYRQLVDRLLADWRAKYPKDLMTVDAKTPIDELGPNLIK